AVSSQAFTSEGLRTEVVAEGGDAQNRAQAPRDGGPPGGRTRALSARARINEPEHLRLGHRKQCRLYLSRDARGRGLRPGSAVLAGKLAPFHPSRKSAAVSGGTGVSIERGDGAVRLRVSLSSSRRIMAVDPATRSCRPWP